MAPRRKERLDVTLQARIDGRTADDVGAFQELVNEGLVANGIKKIHCTESDIMRYAVDEMISANAGQAQELINNLHEQFLNNATILAQIAIENGYPTPHIPGQVEQQAVDSEIAQPLQRAQTVSFAASIPPELQF